MTMQWWSSLAPWRCDDDNEELRGCRRPTWWSHDLLDFSWSSPCSTRLSIGADLLWWFLTYFLKIVTFTFIVTSRREPNYGHGHHHQNYYSHDLNRRLHSLVRLNVSNPPLQKCCYEYYFVTIEYPPEPLPFLLPLSFFTSTLGTIFFSNCSLDFLLEVRSGFTSCTCLVRDRIVLLSGRHFSLYIWLF